MSNSGSGSSRRLSVWLARLLCAACVLTGGCTEVLGPREPYPEPLSVYGILTPDRDTQFVWVSPIEEFPSLGSPDALQNVTVTSTDLETGQERVWEDSIVVRENGQHEYLYRSPFRAEFGGQYRIEVQDGSGGERSWADVRIPPPVRVEVAEAGRNTVSVEITGEQIRALSTEVEYEVKSYDWLRGSFSGPDTSYRRTYWGEERQIESGWRVDIDFNVDRAWVEGVYVFDFRDYLGRFPPTPFLALGETTIHVLVGDENWDPPNGRFDPRILSQPGVLDNVENGTGFIGGGYRIEEILPIPQAAVEMAQWYYCSRPWECTF